jgi:hypothetical protein
MQRTASWCERANATSAAKCIAIRLPPSKPILNARLVVSAAGLVVVAQHDKFGAATSYHRNDGLPAVIAGELGMGVRLDDRRATTSRKRPMNDATSRYF